MIRAYLKISLEAQGYAVQETKDGHEALTLYAEFPAAVVVLDIFMPRKEGLRRSVNCGALRLRLQSLWSRADGVKSMSICSMSPKS
jgi:DNA-binding response OmpR family regulator